eukprot:5663555-Prymnesium_polylepis.1
MSSTPLVYTHLTSEPFCAFLVEVLGRERNVTQLETQDGVPSALPRRRQPQCTRGQHLMVLPTTPPWGLKVGQRSGIFPGWGTLTR